MKAATMPARLNLVLVGGTVVALCALLWLASHAQSWWLVLADPKIGKVIVPPLRIADVPLAGAGAERDWRAYKVQFQAPQQAQVFDWKLYIISDTFVGEEYVQSITVRAASHPLVFFVVLTRVAAEHRGGEAGGRRGGRDLGPRGGLARRPDGDDARRLGQEARGRGRGRERRGELDGRRREEGRR